MHRAHWCLLENLRVFHCKSVCNSEDVTPVSGFSPPVPEDVRTAREASARLPSDGTGAGPSGHTSPSRGSRVKLERGGCHCWLQTRLGRHCPEEKPDRRCSWESHGSHVFKVKRRREYSF